jgi:hypothetical protein
MRHVFLSCDSIVFACSARLSHTQAADLPAGSNQVFICINTYDGDLSIKRDSAAFIGGKGGHLR